MRGERATESVSVYVCLLVVVVNEMYLFHLIFFWIVFLKFSLCFLLYHMFVISFVHGICPFCTYSGTYKDTHTPLTHIYIFNDFGWVQIRFFCFIYYWFVIYCRLCVVCSSPFGCSFVSHFKKCVASLNYNYLSAFIHRHFFRWDIPHTNTHINI